MTKPPPLDPKAAYQHWRRHIAPAVRTQAEAQQREPTRSDPVEPRGRLTRTEKTRQDARRRLRKRAILSAVLNRTSITSAIVAAATQPWRAS